MNRSVTTTSFRPTASLAPSRDFDRVNADMPGLIGAHYGRGRSVSEILAKSLNWPLWDREVLDEMASRSCRHYQARMFNSLDETARGGIDSALYAMLGNIHNAAGLKFGPEVVIATERKTTRANL